MNSEEQMRIIRNWSCEFLVVDDPDGRKVGVLTYHNQYGWAKQVGPFNTYEDVVGVAYNIVKNCVWHKVVECGK
jgi:hypothetical protein